MPVSSNFAVHFSDSSTRFDWCCGPCSHAGPRRSALGTGAQSVVASLREVSFNQCAQSIDDVPSVTAKRSLQAAPCGRVPGSRRSTVVVQAKKTSDGPSIAIVGITGAVGQEFLQVRRAITLRRRRQGER